MAQLDVAKEGQPNEAPHAGGAVGKTGRRAALRRSAGRGRPVRAVHPGQHERAHRGGLRRRPQPARVGQRLVHRARPAGGAARGQLPGRGVPVREGPGHLGWPGGSGLGHSDEELARERRPRAAERRLLERGAVPEAPVPGRGLPARGRGLRTAAQPQRPRGHPGPAPQRRPVCRPGSALQDDRQGVLHEADAGRGARYPVLDLGGPHVQDQQRGHLRRLQRAVPEPGPRRHRGRGLAVLATRGQLLHRDRLPGGRDAVPGDGDPVDRRA
jgi:hypothetical protein